MRGMITRGAAMGLAIAATLGPVAVRASAQAMLADDVVILSKGQQARKQAMEKAAGKAAGAGPFPTSPGSGAPRLAARPSPLGPLPGAQPGQMGVLSAASGYSTSFQGRGAAPAISPLPAPPTPPIPQYGRLELPATEDEGPPNGLTLDVAIDRLVQVSPDLLSKARELPKARADTVTAGLIANPIVFFSADTIPYGGYSKQNNGTNSYGIVLVQPLDINRKRRYRVIVAEQARGVLEAQYADAVRLAIDQLGMAFVDAIEAREILRYKQANVERLGRMVEVARQLLTRSTQARPDLDRMAILRDTAEIELDVARSNLTQTLRALAVLLQIPEAEADSLAIRGTIRDLVPPPPPVDDLVRLAVCNRPDVVAYRRGVQRASADVRLAQRERFEDVFLFYTPYGFQNNAYLGLQSTTSWSLGGLVSIPLFNRNQGNIARAKEGVVQARIELSGVERQAASEVRRAALDYETTGRAVRRFEADILARARRQRDETHRLFTEGERTVSDDFNADRDYNDTVRQYYDSLIRHRRSMIRLNTAVGQRILP